MDEKSVLTEKKIENGGIIAIRLYAPVRPYLLAFIR
jgi:hypothetical protein